MEFFQFIVIILEEHMKDTLIITLMEQYLLVIAFHQVRTFVFGKYTVASIKIHRSKLIKFIFTFSIYNSIEKMGVSFSRLTPDFLFYEGEEIITFS